LARESSLVSDGQLDLFAGSGKAPAESPPPAVRAPGPVPAELDDAALLAAIPASGLADGPLLAAEAGRRRLALEALAAIGGPEAARSVERIIGRRWVQGPTLSVAVAAAARLRSHLPANIVLALLRHVDPAVRGGAACRG
jgi:hypothetical protein